MRRLLALPLVAALLGGCVIHAPSTVDVAAERPTTAWVEQLKLSFEPAPGGVRVAAAAPSSWHRVRLTVGRLDGSAPAAVKTLDPFENELGRVVLGDLALGAEYWVQVDLIHLGAGGVEWVIGSGRLGGGGQKVLFNPGANAIPIAIRPVTAGGRLDASPTPLRRRSRDRTDRIIIIHDNSAPWPEPEPVYDESIHWDPVIDWILEGDEEEDEEEDEEIDLDRVGDWLPDAAALQSSTP